MSQSGPVIGIVGTFDVANYGDLLFPMLAEHELAKRLPGACIRPYSFRAMDETEWVYRVHALEALQAEMKTLSGLLVGGGYLIRFDGDVAVGYSSTASIVHHPTGYWLAPTLVAAEAGVPVVWNAVGVAPRMPAWGRDLLRLLVDIPDVVAAREKPSFDILARATQSRTIRLTPDTAFALNDLLEARAAHAKADDLLQELEVDGPFVVIQASQRLADQRDLLRKAVRELHATGLHVVELPVSLPQRDGPDALALGDLVRRPRRWLSPLELAPLVQRSRATFAYSYHLSITAILAGVPVHRFAAPEGTKYHTLSDYPGVYVHSIEDAEDLAESILASIDAPPITDTTALETRAQVAVHWDELARLFSDPSRGADDRRQRLGWFLQRLPGAIEQSANAASAAEQEAKARLSTLTERVRDADQTRARLRKAEEQVAHERGRSHALAEQLADLRSLFTDAVEARDGYRDVADHRARRITELLKREEELVAGRERDAERIAGLERRIGSVEEALTEARRRYQVAEAAAAALRRITRRRSVRLALKLAGLTRPLFALVRRLRGRSVR